jgi:hypothetical protein
MFIPERFRGVSRNVSVREVGGFIVHTEKGLLILHKRKVFELPYLI